MIELTWREEQRKSRTFQGLSRIVREIARKTAQASISSKLQIHSSKDVFRLDGSSVIQRMNTNLWMLQNTVHLSCCNMRRSLRKTDATACGNNITIDHVKQESRMKLYTGACSQRCKKWYRWRCIQTGDDFSHRSSMTINVDALIEPYKNHLYVRLWKFYVRFTPTKLCIEGIYVST